ncbi:poly(3-hydroxybutyrate) depolymerase [Neptuniibacter sp. QD48_11]|uniref:extracellular catalytic domain type 2 short-chain-length polyhydroxyalkanoate depolymerase n=1 Tax=unclassified Neptuniibacter TaxID=2630693 RepID=UPI0039F4EAA8
MFRLLLIISCWMLTGFAQAIDGEGGLVAPDLPALNAISDQTSISGLSSGGFMAAQYHIAYSENLVGAGIIAGGPWNCVASIPGSDMTPKLVSATTTCMDPCKYSWFGCPESLYPNSRYLSELAKTEAERGSIAKLENLYDDKVYIFSGLEDKTVWQVVGDQTVSFYKHLELDESAIRYDNRVAAGHGFITDDLEDNQCSLTEKPWINNCGFSQARRLLEHIYGELEVDVKELSGELIKFDQTPFISGEYSSLDNMGYVYIPESCRSESCRVHVALHGCRQGHEFLGDRFVKGTGYNETADANRLIILYPQVKPSSIMPLNPRGCWDFWGYSSNNLPPYHYYKRTAPQMKAINQMVNRLTSKPTNDY